MSKKIGQGYQLQEQQLDLSPENRNGQQIAEAYEKLLLDALAGDATNFTHWEEVAYSWKFVDAIRQAWDNSQQPLVEYPCGSMGPKQADELLAIDHRHWIY